MPSNRIRLAIAGCAGGRGSWFTAEAARHPEFEVTALIDRLPDAARVIAADLGLTRIPIFADSEAALAGAKWDALIAATPDAEHTSTVLPALAARKHAYVEKPLATTLEDCLRVARADRAAGGRTMVGFNLRFAPFYRRMRELLSRAGRALTIQADEFYYGGRTYFRRWNRLRSVGGGLWITKACHDFDILSWIAGSLPERVAAQASLSHYVSRPEGGMRCSACPIESRCPDTALPALRALSASWKRIFEIRDASGSWAPGDLCLYNSDKDTFDHGIAQVSFAGDIAAVYTLNVVAAFTDRSMIIGGTEGTLRGSLASPLIQFWRRHASTEVAESIPVLTGAEPSGGHGGADSSLLGEFAKFIRGEPSVAVDPVEASVAVAIGLAATRASDTSRVVEMEELDGWREIRNELSSRAR